MSTFASSGLRSSTSQVRNNDSFFFHNLFGLHNSLLGASFLPPLFVPSLTVDHTGLVTGVAFGENAQFLTSTGMDRSLKFYSL